MSRPDAVLIAGPTASGKSALAMEQASRWDGEIVNTDSMQIYPVLNVLTARPAPDDLTKIPHHLYGAADISKPYSVARWQADLLPVLRDLNSRGKIPVFVGGTGLYFKALLEGLAEIPEIDPEIRSAIRSRLMAEGSDVLHSELQKLDPESAERLKPGDGQRVARALEVVTSTGQAIHRYTATNHSPILKKEDKTARFLLLPERQKLYDRINQRCELMLEQGALTEVRKLLALNLSAESTALRAIGVKPLMDYIEGKQSLEDSVEIWKRDTRRYAKRQMTWFRNQLDSSWRILS